MMCCRSNSIIISLILILGTLSSKSQIDSTHHNGKRNFQNCVYGELLGSGFLFSVHYERTLWKNDALSLNARLGLGSAFLVTAIPTLGINTVFGKKSDKLEIGLNVIRTYALGIMGPNSIYVLANPLIGYRYQSKKGFLFRATFCPFIPVYDPDDFIPPDRKFIPFAGISFGRTF